MLHLFLTHSCLLDVHFVAARQYVGVASNQKDVMLLGGNLPSDALPNYRIPGHEQIDATASEPEKERERKEMNALRP